MVGQEGRLEATSKTSLDDADVCVDALECLGHLGCDADALQTSKPRINIELIKIKQGKNRNAIPTGIERPKFKHWAGAEDTGGKDIRTSQKVNRNAQDQQRPKLTSQ